MDEFARAASWTKNSSTKKNQRKPPPPSLEEHNPYGVDFLRAVEQLKKDLPQCSFSGGLSNLSLSFRGLNEVREPMHAVLLYHAIPKGLNMAIVNAGALPIYSDIDEKLREERGESMG